MIKRIINYLNKHKTATKRELVFAPTVQGELFKFSEIPEQTITEYCYKLARAGYIYAYQGYYVVAQKIPQLTITELNEMELVGEDKLLYQRNKLHSINYPFVSHELKQSLLGVEHLHLMQFLYTKPLDLFDFQDLVPKDVFVIKNILKNGVDCGFIEIKDRELEFTGKYIPFSFDFRTLCRFYNRMLDEEKMIEIERTIEAEQNVIDYKPIYKEWDVPTIKQIEFVKSYINEFDLSKEDRLNFINGLYEALNVFDNYD